MSAPGTPKASQAAITAVQEALGAMNIVGPMRRIFQDDEMADALGVLLAQEIEAVAVAAADAAMASLEVREDVGYGVIIEGTGILMATYDGTAKKYARQVWMTPWVEVPE